MSVFHILILSFWVLISLFFLAASISSFIENEGRAAWILLAVSLIWSAFSYSLLFLLPEDHMSIKLAAFLIPGFILLVFIPFKAVSDRHPIRPVKRVHEQDAVLSRRLLRPGTEDYNAYYKEHPASREADDRARLKPGLLSPQARYYDTATFKAAEADFMLTEHLHLLEQEQSDKRQEILDPESSVTFIRKWMKMSGARHVGFTELKDYHLYSHKGRGPGKGREIKNDLPHAIAITVEMDHDMMKPAPAGTTVMESAEQYLQSGILATKLASFIKKLGYRAKAHIDGNYEVICPLVAMDAGLGVIGRMGLLMTPDLGPRVRIAVVTTDLPLHYKQARHDLGVLDFCKRCKKCAEVCPSDAIPRDSMQEIEGVKRWKISSEDCYLFWTISGSDCGRCVISCPYAHKDTWFHRLIRLGIKNNLFFRIMAVKLDDVFYGKRPAPRALPKWVKVHKSI